MLVQIGLDKDKYGRLVPVYADTDDLLDEDYQEYCRLMKIYEAKKHNSEGIRALFQARSML